MPRKADIPLAALWLRGPQAVHYIVSSLVFPVHKEAYSHEIFSLISAQN
jgi:hypothetical protein